MNRNRTHHRGRTVFLCAAICLCMAGLAGRLFFLMLYKADYYSQMAEELHRRERSIKAPRGRILLRVRYTDEAIQPIVTMEEANEGEETPEGTASL